MAIDPNIALGVKTPQFDSPLQTVGQLMQIKNAGQEYALRQQQAQLAQQKAQQEMEEKRLAVQDENTLNAALKDPALAPKIMGGDLSPLYGKARPAFILNAQKGIDEHSKNAAALDTVTLKNNSDKVGTIAQGIDSLNQMIDQETPWDEVQSAYTNWVGNLKAQGVFNGLPLSQDVPVTLTDPKQLTQIAAGVGGLASVYQKALDRKKEHEAINTSVQTRESAEAKAERESADYDLGHPLKVAQTEQQLADPNLLTGEQRQQAERAAEAARMSQANADAARAVQIRGQDLSAATQRRGQDLTNKRAMAEGGKPLPQTAIKSLETQKNLSDQTERLANTFKDEYGGNTVTGGLEAFLARHGGESVGLADKGVGQWWQDYQTYLNDVRHGTFGAALTPTEKEQFDKQVVQPNMSPDQIRQNLTRQKNITNKALQRVARVYAAGGYSTEQLKEYVPEEGGGNLGSVQSIVLKDGRVLTPHNEEAAKQFRKDHADLIK